MIESLKRSISTAANAVSPASSVDTDSRVKIPTITMSPAHQKKIITDWTNTFIGRSFEIG